MERHRLDALISACGPARAVLRLRAHVTEARQQKIEDVLRRRIRSVKVAIEHPRDPHNAAAIVRTVDALGGGGVHAISDLSGILRARKTTKGAYYWVDTRHHHDLDTLLGELHAEGMRLAGACVEAEGAVPLAEVPVDRPICLMFGNEKTGLSRDARAACDLTFTIPMVGMSESLNLSVSAALALASVLERRRAHLGAEGDGDPTWLARTRARWLAKALDDRFVEALLKPRVEPAPEELRT
ncbi:MAG: RNA methyltransferase [Nannocystaceae bacterium]|nr:RNA methyltransferase [Myxococcales bacterium]